MLARGPVLALSAALNVSGIPVAPVTQSVVKMVITIHAPNSCAEHELFSGLNLCATDGYEIMSHYDFSLHFCNY